MKKPLLFKSLKKNNKGSAMVTVIVSMVFVMALGAALLFSTYMSYKIAISQRRSTEVFYTAESMADDIRFGLQTEATRALKIAYTETMTEYVKADDFSFNPQTHFAETFKNEILSSTVKADGETLNVFSSVKTVDEEALSYNPMALSAYIKMPEDGSDFSLGSGGSYESSKPGTVHAYNDEEGGLTKLSLIKLSLRYKSIDGYESRIITDIAINVPDFYAKPISSGNLSSYAIVAEGGIVKDDIVESDVSGKVYAGSLSISGRGNKLKHNGGDLIVKSTAVNTDGTVKVENGASFVFNSTENELWAGELIADTGGSLNISGRTYVADDLMLGESGKAQLSGSYFGFGDSFAEPKESSAIIVNGEGASLNISGLKRLSLGGISFINILSGEFTLPETEAVPMGESLSVKTNQLAYLVPAECIKNYASNPFVFSSKDVLSPKVILDTELWTINGAKKTLNSYLDIDENNTYLAGTKGRIITLYKNLDGGDAKLAYVFLQFGSHEHANQYFQDFFEAYPDRISEYMESYLMLSDKNVNAKISSAGNTFYMESGDLEDEDTLVLVPASPWSESLKGRFGGFSSPFSSFINTAKLNELENDTLEFKQDGEVVAIVTGGGYSYPQEGESLRLIIAKGEVKVSGQFNGIVLTKGRLTLDGSINGQPLSPDILEAIAEDGAGNTYTLSAFIASGMTSGSSPEGDNPWAPEKLVYYENWTKN